MSNATESQGARRASPGSQPATASGTFGIPEFSTAVALGLLGVLTLAVFADILFFPQGRILSSTGTDLFHQFVHWRRFGFEQLRQGNLALWNPHIYSGAPFLGGFQSALLYPPNVIFLALPLGAAINWSIALHVYLAGAFTYLWVRNRGAHSLAGFFAAVMFMFCGPYFLHIYPGHLPNLCAMVWAPLIFLALDKLFIRVSVSACLLGAFGTAMQVLAGHPQYVFYTALATVLYAGLRLVKPPRRVPVLLGLGAMWLGGAALSAAQLLTSLSEADDMLRSAGVPYQFAAMFSFPPENFLTLAAPWVFGDMQTFPYWGRCFLWESSLYVGVTGLVLAAYGLGRRDSVAGRAPAILVGVLLVLALGAHTPLFGMLYHWVPGFASFRGIAKLVFLAALFMSLLAAGTLDGIIRGAQPPRTFAPLWVGLVSAVCLLAAAWLRFGGTQPWARTFEAIDASGMSYVQDHVYSDPRFVRAALRGASQSLLWSGAAFLMLAVLLWMVRRSPAAIWGVVALGTAELLLFARGSLSSFELARTDFPELRADLAANPGDYRIFNAVSHNSAMSVGAADLWGSDPGVLRRYAEFMAFSQGLDPKDATQDIAIARFGRLHELLRARFTFLPKGGSAVEMNELPGAMPRLQLVSRCRVLTGRQEILAALTNSAFNPREEVILEETPNPQPEPSNNPGAVNLLNASTDRLVIEAKVDAPAILLITDTYAKGWKARALPGSSQSSYAVMPADYCLRAVPLGRGYHRFQLEYRPDGFSVGKWVSLASLILCAALAWRVWRPARAGR